MAETGKLDLVERLTNECIDLCRSVLRGRKLIDPLVDPAFRTERLKRALDEQKTAIGEMEMAVDRIMSAVERIGEIDFSARADAGEQIASCCEEIMEACCFQDITGQRLTHVMGTLGDVRKGLDELAGGRQSANASPAASGLLNGPALPGDAMEQDAVDKLLASGGK
ncbi:MAG: protein phosphatase CheZ [Alphaproteobacteria bacterium]|nr:protein phosphatase CheZ [Alphaproteobacteria bacterium]MDX5415442.1 protein phosphatase CheZ [Alphaproteobacteria bacterium]MDX5492670.1 protein phosphatase CheZ [Alphaproteobacteria bacterium]